MQIGSSLVSCSALLLVCGLSACSSDASSDNATGAAGSSGSGAGNAGNAGSAGESLEIAQWPMPNSPGLGLPNPQSYDPQTVPGVVHDLVTSLDWLQDPGTTLYSRADALGLCDALSYAGFKDWRAPTFIELVSLFNVVPNDSDPLVPIYISPTFKAEGRFWSTTPVTSNGLGRLLDFTADGCSAVSTCSIGVSGKADEALGGAFCVRNNEPPSNTARYTVNGNEVTDLRTGLVWLTVPVNVQTGTHDEALNACDALGNGARLPSIGELLSLVVPILDRKTFPGWPGDAFAWSSSSLPDDASTFWLAAIGGATKAASADSHNRTECVR